MENWSVTRKYRTRQGCSPVTTAVASGGVQEDWTTKPSRLASLPQSSLSYCSHRSLTTGLDGLLVWPVRTFLVLFLFPHTNLSALVGSTAKQKIQIQNLSLCTVSIFAHTHTQDPERMLLSLYILLDYLSFPLKYGLSFGSQPADFRRQCCWTAVSCCTGIQYYLTAKENNS